MPCLGRVSKPLCKLRTQCFSDGVELRVMAALISCPEVQLRRRKCVCCLFGAIPEVEANELDEAVTTNDVKRRGGTPCNNLA